MNKNIEFIKETAKQLGLDYDTVYLAWYKHIGGNCAKFDYEMFYKELKEIANKTK